MGRCHHPEFNSCSTAAPGLAPSTTKRHRALLAVSWSSAPLTLGLLVVGDTSPAIRCSLRFSAVLLAGTTLASVAYACTTSVVAASGSLTQVRDPHYPTTKETPILVLQRSRSYFPLTMDARRLDCPLLAMSSDCCASSRAPRMVAAFICICTTLTRWPKPPTTSPTLRTRSGVVDVSNAFIARCRRQCPACLGQLFAMHSSYLRFCERCGSSSAVTVHRGAGYVCAAGNQRGHRTRRSIHRMWTAGTLSWCDGSCERRPGSGLCGGARGRSCRAAQCMGCLGYLLVPPLCSSPRRVTRTQERAHVEQMKRLRRLIDR